MGSGGGVFVNSLADRVAEVGGPYTWNYGGTTGWITFDIPDVPIEPGVVGTNAQSFYRVRQW